MPFFFNKKIRDHGVDESGDEGNATKDGMQRRDPRQLEGYSSFKVTYVLGICIFKPKRRGREDSNGFAAVQVGNVGPRDGKYQH